MVSKGAWAGWVAFAGMLMMIVGGLDMLQGLVALIRDEYFVLTPQGALVIDVSDWGWIMLIWGALLILVGWGLLSGASWARWTAILGISLNFVAQLGFNGGVGQVSLWGLCVVAMNIVILYALTVRWDEAKAGAGL
ncbi:MAG TPA: hypothetical protein VFR32_03980 [Gaiellaceae bacterium]|nr:hypothetical protein [Gaiellaceae bacterium]